MGQDSAGKQQHDHQLASRNPSTVPNLDCELYQAGERLHRIEKLLILPTPEAIREASLLLDEALLLVQQFSRMMAEEATSDLATLQRKVYFFQIHCQRVSKLLEGALRIQWIRMRWIASFTQTYTATAKLKTWKPSLGNLKLEM